MDDPTVAAPVNEALYQQTMDELRTPQPLSMSSLVFVVLMLVFVGGLFMNLRSPLDVLLLVGAVVFHEAGHALGMRLFGFRDVRMFFIPFFGAAVSGNPRGAAAWKEAMVSLLGPLPGILAGVALLFFSMRQPHPVALPFHAVGALVWLNGFNLLPLGFLDGGRFLERVVFSRHRLLQVSFQAVGSVLLGLFALKAGMYVLALFVALSLIQLPARWRTLTAAAELKEKHPGLDPDPDRLGDPEGHVVFAAAESALKYPASERPGNLAREMEAILDAVKRAPGVLASLGLVLLYAFGIACALAGILVLSLNVGPVEWKTYRSAGWSADFPREPINGPEGTAPGDSSWRTIVDGTERFTLTVVQGEGTPGWEQRVAEKLAKETATKLGAMRPVDVAGHPGLEFELSAPNRVVRARMVNAPPRRYQVTASAPKWGENQRRFLESFAVHDSLAGR